MHTLYCPREILAAVPEVPAAEFKSFESRVMLATDGVQQ